MVSLTKYQLPSLVMLVLGVLVVVQGMHLYPNPGQQEYNHFIEPTSAASVPAEADVLTFESLSPEGQRAVRKALESPGESVTVRGEANKPPEFFYSDNSNLNRGRYFIQYQGEYYELYTAAGGLYGDYVALAAYCLAGGVLVTVGLFGFSSPRPRLPVVVLVGLLACWATFELGVYGWSDDTQLVVAIGAGLTLVPAFLTWYALGRTPHWAGTRPDESPPSR